MEEKKVEILDIAAKAENVIKRLKEKQNDKLALKTSQLRKFLSAVNAISNKVDVFQAQHPAEKKLPIELAGEIKYLKVKFTYQAGRDRAVRQFGDAADIKKCIDRIGTSLTGYRKFAQFVEALVAYHKYYGGKD